MYESFACMYVYVCMSVCMQTTCISFACGGQKKELAPLELQLELSLSYHVVLVTEGRQGVSQFLSYFSSSSLFEGVSLCNPDWPN